MKSDLASADVEPVSTSRWSSQGWITGIAQYVLDPTDPFPEGFRVADIWGGIS
jgi:proline racemase